MKKVYDKSKVDEIKRNAFITEKLPEYFGVKAVQHQRSVMKGRHPNSLKKDDELWHYSRVSNERHRLVKGGKGFWGAIHASAKKHEEIPNQLPELHKKGSSQKEEFPTLSTEHVVSTPSVHVSVSQESSTILGRSTTGLSQRPKTTQTEDSRASGLQEDKDKHTQKIKNSSSLQAQLKNAMSTSAGDLNLKVDFLNRSLLHFNMTFMIMNYNHEVIYIDRDNLLRVKHISKIQPGDRVRFKMVDLSNPSNPNTIRFGDNVWLQVVDNPDTVVDSTFQTGSVLTSKLFSTSDVKGFTFDPIDQSNANKYASTSTATPHASTSSSRLHRNRTSLSLRPTHTHHHHHHHYHNHHNQHHSNGALSTTSSQSILDLSQSAQEDDEEEEGSGSSSDEDNNHRRTGAFSTSSSPWRKKKTIASQESTEMDYHHNHRQDLLKKQLKICGHTEVQRIVDTKKIEQLPETTILSDEKASRYISRSAMHLGKWSVETAVLMNDRSKVQQYFFGDLTHKPTKPAAEEISHPSGGGGDDQTTTLDPIDFLNENDSELAFEVMVSKIRNSDTAALKAYIKTHPLSLTPVIIQQDQYCLSTATAEEYQQWPRDSSKIIESSLFVASETKTDIQEEYETFLQTQHRFNLFDSQIAPHATSVLEKLNKMKQSQLYLLQLNSSSTNPTTNTATSPTAASGAANITTATAAGTSLDSPNHPAPASSSSGNNINSNSSSYSHSYLNDGYCCLRRVVRKSAPYEFNIDQRCVWRFCLYEQFSDNDIQSEREKEVKKSMETATMVLKLSRMNRQGARVHIQSNHLDNLPSLVSGENFPRQLREITFQLQQKKNAYFLAERRLNEQYLEEYFQHKIQTVLEQEENGFRPSSSSPNSKTAGGGSLSSPYSFTIPRPGGGSSYAPLFATAEHHQFDSDYFEQQDDEEAMSTQFSLHSDENNGKAKEATIVKVRAKSAYFTGKEFRQGIAMLKANEHQNHQQQQQQHPLATDRTIAADSGGGKLAEIHTGRGSLVSQTKAMPVNSSSAERPYENTALPRKRPETAAAATTSSSSSSLIREKREATALTSVDAGSSLFYNNTRNSNSNSQRPHTTASHISAPTGSTAKKEYSEDIKKVFDTTIVPPYQKRLLLTNSTALHGFEELSVGEQLLSYHKTLSHISRNTKTILEAKAPIFKAKNPGAGVNAKIERLKEEDLSIEKMVAAKVKRRLEAEVSESGLC